MSPYPTILGSEFASADQYATNCFNAARLPALAPAAVLRAFDSTGHQVGQEEAAAGGRTPLKGPGITPTIRIKQSGALRRRDGPTFTPPPSPAVRVAHS